VPALAPAELLEPQQQATDWQAIRQRIAAARSVQLQRSGKLNSALGLEELQTTCVLERRQRMRLAHTMQKLGMSARGIHRVIKLARTIADYEQRANIATEDLLEAVSYRRCQLLQALHR